MLYLIFNILCQLIVIKDKFYLDLSTVLISSLGVHVLCYITLGKDVQETDPLDGTLGVNPMWSIKGPISCVSFSKVI